MVAKTATQGQEVLDMNRIKRLIIIAGPSCVGKTRLVGRLREEETSSLRTLLNLDQISSWEFSSIGKLKEVSSLSASQVVLQYDLHRLWLHNCREYENDKALGILDTVADIAFLTMWESPAVLLQRCNQRIRRTILTKLFRPRRLRKALHKLRRLRKKRYFYENPSELWRQYSKWFDFCGKYDANVHWTVRGTALTDLVQLDDTPSDVPFWETGKLREQESGRRLNFPIS